VNHWERLSRISPPQKPSKDLNWQRFDPLDLVKLQCFKIHQPCKHWRRSRAVHILMWVAHGCSNYHKGMNTRYSNLDGMVSQSTNHIYVPGWIPWCQTPSEYQGHQRYQEHLTKNGVWKTISKKSPRRTHRTDPKKPQYLIAKRNLKGSVSKVTLVYSPSEPSRSTTVDGSEILQKNNLECLTHRK